MFNYDPRKYRDIDMEDDRNMESNAYQILREEKFSSYIGRKEDEEEWKKIMQEEKRRKNN